MIRGGQNYVSSAPALSNDAKRLLVCTGNTVTVFSTSTGVQVSSLQGHTAPVTSVIVVPSSTNVLCYCWTSSLDGTIRHWDFSLSESITTIVIRFPIFSMVIPSILFPAEENNARTPNIFAYVSVEVRNAQDTRPQPLCGQIRKCNLTNYQALGNLILKETERPASLTISPLGNFLGIKDKRKLHIWKVPKMDSDSAVSKKITLHHTKTFTVLAFHPTDRIVAAGDVTGRILIWRGFGTQKFLDRSGLGNRRSMSDGEDKPGVRENDDAESCSTWHWHSAGVRLLYFSSDGAYLYSGGKEGVLILWQLETGKKKFLPRIGSPLLYFIDSPDPSLSLISCADNQIHVLKVYSMEIMRSISGIKPPPSSPEACSSLNSKIAFDCTSGLVAVQTENYCIQFYSLFANRGLYEVQVCERDCQPVDEITVVVALVELSVDGSMMCTVEVKLPEEGIGSLVCLKFWDLGSDSKRFSVSTLIYEPHRDAHISAIAFHPNRRMAVSSSYGGDFKIWACKDEIQQKGQILQNSGWMCHAVGSYKNKAMRAATFSADGSVLAAAADTVITLWDPDKNVLMAVIGEAPSPIVSVAFGGKSKYLLSVSDGSNPQLSVWSMSKLAASWSYRLQIEAVSCAMDSSYFAILALLPESNKHTFKGDGMILLFNVADPIPVASWSVTKAKGGGLAFLKGDLSGLAAIDGKPSQTLLAYINGDREFALFDPWKYGHELSTTMKDDLVTCQETGQFGYMSIYGELPKFDLKTNKASSVLSGASERPWETMFSGSSSHMLPPLTKLCSEFLESLLEKRTAIVE